MEVIFLPEAESDLNFWIKTGNKAILKKIADLTKSILDNPFKGIGKPVALKYDLAPKWSRRINQEHRFIYLIENNKLFVFSLKGHYKK